MEATFKLTEQNYRYLFEHANDAMWVHDMDGNIIDANQADEIISGYSRDELIGCNAARFLTQESLDLAREVRRKLLSGEELVQPYEQRLVRKDGTIRIVNIVTSPVIIDGEAKGFLHVARDVTEERRLHENMRFYVQRITQAQEDERKRLARELHDDVAPSLLIVIQRLNALISGSRSKLSMPLKSSLEELRTEATEALDNLHRYAQDLRPRILDDLGLIPALEWMTEQLAREQMIDARVEVTGTEQGLLPEVTLLLFRIAQEALNNIRRHARASRVVINLEFETDRVKMVVKDNGKGFNMPARAEDLVSMGKLGILGMFERARLAGGSLGIHSKLDQGTQVITEVPLPTIGLPLSPAQPPEP